MRIWPTKWEIRTGPNDPSGLGAYLGDLSTYLNDGSAAPNVNQTAAVEFALGNVGRAFYMADITPAIPALTPLTLAMLARQTLAKGNAVFRIEIDGRRRRQMVLTPVADYSIRGDVREESWRYTIKQYRPMGADEDEDGITANVPYEGMVHVRYMPRFEKPWLGVSPFVGAGLTAKQLAYIERNLAYDAEAPAGYYIPLSHGASSKTTESAQNGPDRW